MLWTTPSRNAASVVRALLLLGLTPMLMASRCNPTPEGGSCTPISCTGNQAPACLNFCRPLPPPGQAHGAVCVVDTCDSTLFRVGAVMCPDGFACSPNTGPLTNHNLGTCQFATTPLAGCHPVTSSTGFDSCETGTYCRPFDATFPRPRGFNTQFGGLCAPPVREDGACVSDLHGAGSLQCESGTHCVHHGLQSGLGTCERQCNSDADCSCTTAQTEHLCSGSGNLETCRVCMQNRVACDLQRDPLCCDHDGGAVCTQNGSHAECCHPDGQACSMETECCTGHRCAAELGHAADGCISCAGPGAPPRYGDERACCNGLGLDPSHSTCETECVVHQGSTNVTNPDTNGQFFFDGETFDPDTCLPGHWCCIPQGICQAHIACPSPAEQANGQSGRCVLVGQMPEVCNGLDDDCDGIVDNHLTLAPMHCPVPAAPDLAGGCTDSVALCPVTCENGQEVIGAPTGWCAIGDDGERLDHRVIGAREQCFPSGNVNCTANNDCAFADVCCGILNNHANCIPNETIAPGTCWSAGATSTVPANQCPGVSSCQGSNDCGGCLDAEGCGWCSDGGGYCTEGGDSRPAVCLSAWFHGSSNMCPP